MAYLIKHMSNWDGERTVCNCQTSLPVLYPSHPYKHPSIVSSDAPISNWKAHQQNPWHLDLECFSAGSLRYLFIAPQKIDELYCKSTWELVKTDFLTATNFDKISKSNLPLGQCCTATIQM